MTGKLLPHVQGAFNIYIRDPYCENKQAGDYSGWKKAVINADKTFFAEDILINPGTKEKKIANTLEMALVYASGEVFSREISLVAGPVVLPIVMTLSAHALEGETGAAGITIHCAANIEHISSWSIDFNGDGVFDAIDPDSSREKSWTTSYSSLGRINPRVRIITGEGAYFSVADSLIIHEKITEATHKMLAGSALAMDEFYAADLELNLIYVLVNTDNGQVINIHSINKRDNIIEMFDAGNNQIDLAALGIKAACKIQTLDRSHLLIAAADNTGAWLYEITANSFGNFSISNKTYLNGRVKDLAIYGNRAILSFENLPQLAGLRLENKLILPATLSYFDYAPEYIAAPPAGVSLNLDSRGILAADPASCRVLRFTDLFGLEDVIGDAGTGEKEFLSPEIIRAFENRILVYDRARRDIQVFDNRFTPLCTIGFNPLPEYRNYLEEDFFTGIIDMALITREENHLLYYYVILLSGVRNKIAMLRLPQWEELRATAGNNKIVFVQNGEIFSAGADGHDIIKLFSSDSIPVIEGTLDYPALSPEGRSLVFTSRRELFTGEETGGAASGSQYNLLYRMDIDSKTVKRIPIGVLNGYEIERPLFNSNGTKLVFSARRAYGNWQIYTCDIASGYVENVFPSDENLRYPVFSPDDQYVAFTTDYDGDEEIAIMDLNNKNTRVRVTVNTCRDSLPVWNTIYPFEIANPDHHIESKIAFVSGRNFHKGLYYVYLASKGDGDIRIVTGDGLDVGNNPDSAAVEVTTVTSEGDYPCFTGDGTKLFYEYYDGNMYTLQKYDFETKALSGMERFGRSRRPAGMKNRITGFSAENVNGNEILLGWNAYRRQNLHYFIQYRINREGENFIEKDVYGKTTAALKGLEMGSEYLVRVCLVENYELAATSQWQKVKIQEVAARPTVTLDAANPYLVRLQAWKPRPEVNWKFSWVLDETDRIEAGGDQETFYEFSTSGFKYVKLIVTDSTATYTDTSLPVEVEITSDIKPVIDALYDRENNSLKLSCANALGRKIDFNNALWTISGPGRDPVQYSKKEVIANLNGFRDRVCIDLSLPRLPVGSRLQTDWLSTRKTIDLGMDADMLIPVITYTVSANNARHLSFTGQESKGNIAWPNARWNLFAGDREIYTTNGVSAIDYLFPETNNPVDYLVCLNVTSITSGLSKSISQPVYVEAAPIVPNITYDVLTVKEGNAVTGAKLILDCTKSAGSGIDFSRSAWDVPLAASYGEESRQYGPTAVYSLTGIEAGRVIDISLSLFRSSGQDVKTTTKTITLDPGSIPAPELRINKNIEETSEGISLVLDVLKSKGPNIQWEKTEWQISGSAGNLLIRGPVARIDIPASGEKQQIRYTSSLYCSGLNQPLVKSEIYTVESAEIIPFIEVKPLSAMQANVYELSALNSQGVNIDWERTLWFIYDGNENVIIKQGSVVSHAFSLKAERMSYPVLLKMFMKGSSLPFTCYKTIDVCGDMFMPIIMYKESPDDPYTIHFDASAGSGGGIDWNQAKWSFGDSSESQYGAAAVHRYLPGSASRIFRVSLTLTRHAVNGTAEALTATKEITLAGDTIRPVITAGLYDRNYLVLSAEASQGAGLLLDRASWLFEGEGDSVGYETTTQSGIIRTNTYALERSASAGVSIEYGCISFSASAGVSSSSTITEQDYDDYVNGTSSFSTSNSQVGPICRRYIPDEELNKDLYVTLFVYRPTKDGSVKGESITVKIKPAEARVSAGNKGVSYGK